MKSATMRTSRSACAAVCASATIARRAPIRAPARLVLRCAGDTALGRRGDRLARRSWNGPDCPGALAQRRRWVAGVVLSFDVDPASGWLVDESLEPYVERHIGDARDTLPAALADRRVGVFVHDSLHTYEHERFELETALVHRDDVIVLISDNSHASTALPDVCSESGLRYSFFRERPLEHFYPGAGMGIGV